MSKAEREAIRWFDEATEGRLRKDMPAYIRNVVESIRPFVERLAEKPIRCGICDNLIPRQDFHFHIEHTHEEEPSRDK